MDIKIEEVDKVPPDIPTADITNIGAEKFHFHIIFTEDNYSFNGVTNSSGKLLLYPLKNLEDYLIATVMDGTLPIENAIVDGTLQITSGPYVTPHFSSAKVHAITPDKSKEASIDWPIHDVNKDR